MQTNDIWKKVAEESLAAAENMVEEVLPEVNKEDIEQLQLATKQFLVNIQEVYKKILQFNEVEKASHYIRDVQRHPEKLLDEKSVKQAEEFVEKYKEFTIKDHEFKGFISQVDKYQKRLNEFFGKKIETIYTCELESGEVEVYRLIGDLSQAVRQDIASRGQGLSARYNTISSDDIKNQIYETVEFKYNTNNLTQAYLDILSRGRYSKQFLNKNGVIIIWKPESRWKKMYVGQEGDIGEAYLSFLMSEERAKLFKGNREVDIDIFMEQGVAMVDNISGLFKGDFSVNDIDYAAKTKDSSIMGYRQVINMALNIYGAKTEQINELMVKELRKIQEKEKTGSGRRNKSVKNISEHLKGITQRKFVEEMKKFINLSSIEI